MEVGLNPGDFVLDADPAPPPKGWSLTQFSAHVYCGQTAAWIKMPLGTEVGLGRVAYATLCLMWTQLPPEKRAHLPHLTQSLAHVYCGQMAGWMKTPLGTEVDIGAGYIVLDGVPALRERVTAPPSFWPMSIVATVAHLSYC